MLPEPTLLTLSQLLRPWLSAPSCLGTHFRLSAQPWPLSHLCHTPPYWFSCPLQLSQVLTILSVLKLFEVYTPSTHFSGLLAPGSQHPTSPTATFWSLLRAEVFPSLSSLHLRDQTLGCHQHPWLSLFSCGRPSWITSAHSYLLMSISLENTYQRF